jgi:hypothetical protein
MPMNGIVLPGVYERISIKSTIHKSPGLQVRAFLFLKQVDDESKTRITNEKCNAIQTNRCK